MPLQMHVVVVTEARRGAKKVSHTMLLQSQAGLSLSEAKAVTDAVLEGKSPLVEVPNEEAARKLVYELAQLGFSARIVERT